MINHAIAVGAEYGFTLFRNSVGFVVRDGRKIRYGLGPGSSDLVGWYRPGDGTALFAAIEVKFSKKVTDLQKRFVAAVKNAGGIAGIWHKDDDVHSFFRQLVKEKENVS
jgi:hypothetical protein